MSAHPSIVIGASTGYIAGSNTVALMCLYENKASLGYTSGMVKFVGSKHDMSANLCYEDVDPVDVHIDCAPTTAYNLKNLAFPYVSGQGNFNYGCIESFGCSAGDNCTNNTCTTWGSRTSFDYGIQIRPANATAPPTPTGLTITPGSGTLTIGWNSVTDPTGGEVFAYRVAIFDGSTPVINGYTEAGLRQVTIGGLTNGKAYSVKVYAISHNGYPSPAATGSGTPVGATNPQVFNICWGTTITPPCSLPPQMPAVPAGTSIKVVADIANSGPNGKVRAVFKANGTQISDQNSTLNTYPGGGLWSPTVNYTMPNANVTLEVDAYGWDGTKWVQTDTKSVTISTSAPACSSITLTPFAASVKAGDKITLTATTTPSSTPFTVVFVLLETNTILGQCTTSGGSCQFVWDTTGLAPSDYLPTGTYHVFASVPLQCQSPYSSIQVSAPINQWNVNIYVKDANTNSPVKDASVAIGTQTKQTDATGYVQFRVDEGQIYITISKSGYNPFSTTELVFSDKTFNYALVPVGAAKGSVQFVSIPVGAEIFLDGTDQGVKTPFTVTDIPAGKHTFTLKLAGYNDATGEVEVIGGSVIQVYMELSPATPTAGSLYAASMPLDANIFIDNTDQNAKTPAMITSLTPGSHTVKLTKTGYQDWTGTVNIVAGTTQYINPTLPPLTTIGTLEINSAPQGARVYLDGTDQQKVTPATILNLLAGSRTYKLTKTGYKDAAGTVTIEAGKTAVLTITLKKTEAPATPASTYALGLAAVAVVAVAVVAASR